MPWRPARDPLLVADDQAIVRAGVTLLLRTAGEAVVTEAADGHEADGIEATRRILAALPGTHVLMLTTFDDAEVYGALSAGAVGYFLKNGQTEATIDAVRRAARGEPCSPRPSWPGSWPGPSRPTTTTSQRRTATTSRRVWPY